MKEFSIIYKRAYLLFTLLLFVTVLNAQDDLMSMLDAQVEEEPVEVVATFKSTHVINCHSIERMKAGQLDFRINHRFGEMNQGFHSFWGFDQAMVSFDFGYGVTDWLMVGLRRSNFEETIDPSVKFSILRQTTGSKVIPVSLSYYTNVAINSTEDDLLDSVFNYRLGYTHQLLVARKFSEALSLQIMPTYVHKNLVNFDEENDIMALGIGGRYKFSRRVALTFEYFWASHTADNPNYFNPLSLGFDIETGGHVFQLFFTNARVMEETGFISKTTGDWMNNGIYFGFNISRVFAIGGGHHK